MLFPDILAQSTTITPWFTNPGLIGGILGSVVGLLGAAVGVGMGICAPRGIGKNILLRGQLAIVFLGFVILTAGIIALSTGQPYAVWYPLVLAGCLMSFLFAALYPVARNVYRQAEHRKLNAEEFRTS